VSSLTIASFKCSSLYLSFIIMTSPARAVAKYCDEHVCAFVCPQGYLRNHTHILYQFLCLLPTAMTQSSSGRVTKSQGEGAVLAVFFPIDNALYSIAFVTHTEMAEPIEMLFG